jgi:hypothetical protein
MMNGLIVYNHINLNHYNQKGKMVENLNYSTHLV